MIGNAHLDPVWLWGWQAGADEAVATCRAAADICDDYPEFVFTRGEAWVYKQVATLAPDVFERVRALVERGQWHVIGGQVVQPDCNLITEQAWREQFVRGRRYFEDELGLRSTLAYNVDSFGHPATLPDLLSELGFRGYLFHRPRPEQVELPAQTFRWRGTGGGEVIGFRIVPGYNAAAPQLPDRIMAAVEAANPKIGHAMCFYGVGNHGGGPTREAVEYILEHRQAFPNVELRFSTPDAYFDAVEPFREQLPVVDYELQQVFPGCYSVMHDVKQRQRRGEHLLDQSRRLVSRFAEDAPDLHQRIGIAWDDLLFTSFHDILAGTSIPSAWDSVGAMQGRAVITGEEVVHTVTRRWARAKLPEFAQQQIVVVNADEADWEGYVETEPSLYFDRWGRRWLSDTNGEPIDFQLVQPEAHLITNRILFPCRVASGGALQVLVRDDEAPAAGGAETDVRASPTEIANGVLRVQLAPSGIGQVSLGDHPLLGSQGIGLTLREDHSDTWSQHRTQFDEPIVATVGGGEWVVEESGPLRARARLVGVLGRSPFRWTASLYRGDPRLLFELEITFCEQDRLLQMPLELGAPVTGRLDGQAAGSVARAPGMTEWPVQGWSRVTTGGRDVALVTNDAYSISLDERIWRWTLLRSPKMAWYGGQPEVYAGHDTHTDQGAHSFCFAFSAADALDPAALATATRQSGQPPIVFDRYEGIPVRTPDAWLGVQRKLDA